MRYGKYLLLGVALSAIASAPAQAQIWQDVQNTQSPKTVVSVLDANQNAKQVSSQIPWLATARQLHLNTNDLRQRLNQAPLERVGTSNALVKLPLPNGTFATYKLYNSPIMSKALAQANPDIQTFKVVDFNNPANTGRLDIGPSGFHAMLTHDGDTIFIDPIGNNGQYQSYLKSDYILETDGNNHLPVNCLFKGHDHTGSANKNAKTAQKVDVSYGTNLQTYRLAVAATGEFTAFHGGTKTSALAAMVTGINRVNQVFETDVAVKLELVANNSDIIFTDANTDPFTDNSAVDLIDEVGPEIDSKIGVANYDVGHVFSTGGGGLASLGSVCRSDKAQGVTGSSNPINDAYFIDFVAHELGHQFDANHTFNSVAGGCDDNRETTAAYEPGGGTTIMGYAGLCANENTQTQGDDYFHNHSLGEISEFVADVTRGGSCGATSSLNNAVPVSNAGSDFNIPASTPFTLTGSATDADAGDTLSYTWEQYDLGGETSNSIAFTDDGARPLFRSMKPSTSPSRTFPQIDDILNSTTTYGEIYPTTNRDLNFRLTVRDGNGGVASNTTTITVSSAAGPFTVTAPASVTWAGSSNQTITWDVANTTAAPVNCANVGINLSTDGGQTFPTTIIASTPNDGSEAVSIPNSATTTGRIRVQCATQPFFAINSANITITAAGANSAPVANGDSTTVTQDSAAADIAVLGNDTDSDGDTLTITSITNISDGGTATINGTNISYQPANGFSGTETFTYNISDGNGGTDSATVTVTVEASNTAPVASADSFTVAQDSGTASFGVLNNDTDADGDTLSISSVSNISNGGTATISGTNINYRPATGFSGTETFIYEISDGNGGTDTATVTVTVTPSNTGGGGGGTGGGNTGGGGGGSFGAFMLLLLGLGGAIKKRRFARNTETV